MPPNDDPNIPAVDSNPSHQAEAAPAKVDLRALAEEILKLMKAELGRENERLGR